MKLNHFCKYRVEGICLILTILVLFSLLWNQQTNLYASYKNRVMVAPPPYKSRDMAVPVTSTIRPTTGGIQQRKLLDCISEKPLLNIKKGVRLEKFVIPTGGKSFENSKDRTSSFQNVYKYKMWGTDARYKGYQGSGAGSTSHYAQNMIKILSHAIDTVKANTGKKVIRLLDIPCGDMVWIPQLLDSRKDIEYTGMDIVPELIERHRVNFKHKNWTFVNGDIVATKLNETYDIIHCRHMLQHLRTQDAFKALNHFSHSGAYLVTTTWAATSHNGELGSVQGGRFRAINLELPPFRLPPPLCMGEDWPERSPFANSLYMGVWKLPLTQIPKDMYKSNTNVIVRGSKFYSPMYRLLNVV